MTLFKRGSKRQITLKVGKRCTNKWNQVKVDGNELETYFQKLGVLQTAEQGFNKLFGNQLNTKPSSNNKVAPEPLSDEKEDLQVSIEEPDTSKVVKAKYPTRKQEAMKHEIATATLKIAALKKKKG